MNPYEKHKLKFPKKVEDLSKEPFLAILKPTSSTYAYDDTHNVTDESWDMEVYQNEEEWEAEIKRLVSNKSLYNMEFLPVKIIPATVNVDVKININTI